jgi:ribosomal-protein-alanine N-acetyltransferase
MSSKKRSSRPPRGVPKTAIRGQLVELRPLQPSDAPALNLILRDRRATRFLPPRVRRETGKQFVARALRESRLGAGPAFAILPLGADEAIGQIRFVQWVRLEKSAEVGYWIRRKHWGRGFGTESLRLMCAYGFGELLLRRIEAIVVAGNIGSSRVLEKVGFRREGISRQAVRADGRWRDDWRFGILRGELGESRSR